MPLSHLYPEIEPFSEFRLKVDDLHELYVEQSGNKDGKPVVVLHGGPGGGSQPSFRRFFDPSAYRIIVFDQRGCGKSTPHSELKDNTTWHLVSDIERIREHLGIETWQVFGGSWGSTLALAYAERHPSRVSELVLRGIFMLREEELHWFYQKGASFLFPEAFAEYQSVIPESQRGDLLSAYHDLLTGPDERLRAKAAAAWSRWELGRATLLPDASLLQKAEQAPFSDAFAPIENHFFINKGFFECDGQLLRDAGRLKGIAGTVVHGRYDVICPVKNAVDLHAAWPESTLKIIDQAGHAQGEAGISKALVRATNAYRS